MHTSSMLRMNWFVDTYLSNYETKDGKIAVLDVGSYDVNGSYKCLFDADKFSYLGLDMESGSNVDIVAKKPYSWEMLQNESFDVVISGQAFEHMEFFWLVLQEMIRVLKPCGLICVIAPRSQNLHRYPIDCYRFDTDGMIALARFGNLQALHASTNLAPLGASPDWYYHVGDSMLVAKKTSDWIGCVDVKSYNFAPNQVSTLESKFVSQEIGCILNYCVDFGVRYVYGIGYLGEKAANILDIQGMDICGFIVSDDQQKTDYFMQRPVYYLSEVDLRRENVVVIIAMSRENKVKVVPMLISHGAKKFCSIS